jgi:Flp pilus assembly protein TadD
VIAIDAKNAAAHLNLGYVLITLGQKAAGDAEIRTAAKLDPAYDNRLPAATTTSGASGPSKT